MTAPYDNLELHLAAVPLSRKHAQRIKACCGSYSKCLSHYANRRYVLVPASERALIDDLARTYSGWGGKVTMIARAERGNLHNLPAWVVVQEVNSMLDTSPTDQFERSYAAAYANAVKRGIIR